MSATAIKELRAKTGCGVMDCKNALKESGDDFDKAIELLRQRGLEKAQKKSGREAGQGRVETYIHAGNKIGVMVEVNCETDFVAKNEDFADFAKGLAMHIAAMNPVAIREEDVSPDLLAVAEDKELLIKERVLLNQKYVKDSSKTIQDMLNELVAKIGENIQIGRFARFDV